MFKEALKIYELPANKTPGTYKNEIALTQMNLADLYTTIKHFEESEILFKKELEFFQKLENETPGTYKNEIAMSQHNLAYLYSELNRFA